MAKYSLFKVMELQAPPLLAAFITAMVYVYHKEIDDREMFLNELENESWKILPDDILFTELIGTHAHCALSVQLTDTSLK